MKITTNGEPQEVNGHTVTIAELLNINSVEMPEMVSVQLNGVFVNRDAYDSTVAKDGDEVDFLYFMAGGGGG